ncbi:MAG: hypothetical protein ABR987_01385 [Terracidiphilus sp.]
MRLCWRIWTTASIGFGLLVFPAQSHATSCTTQAELLPQDRDALASIGGRLAVAVVGQDYATLQAALLPAESSEWDGIHDAVERGAPMVKGGQVQLRNIYLLDASTLTAPADTQFFCSNSSGSLTVTMNMRSLPPGRYAVVLADAVGSPLAGQIGLVLAWDPTAAPAGWKLAGLTVRPGTFDGHDNVWFWTRARELMKEDQPVTNNWPAWFSYEAARYLSVPVDFISSPNLEKLGQEQAQIKNSPQDAFPYSLQDGERTWKIEAVRLDASLHQADLAVTYDSTGVSDPSAVRTEANAVLSALLKAQPGLRANFHGLWAVAMKDGKTTPVIELPMAQIP